MGTANFKISSHLCRLPTILPQCQLKSFHFLMMFFCNIEENTKETRWGKIISDLIFLQTFDPEEGVLRSSIQYTPKVRRFEKIEEFRNQVKSQKSPPHLKVEHQGWTIACSNEQTGKVNFFFNESSRLYLLSRQGLVFSSGIVYIWTSHCCHSHSKCTREKYISTRYIFSI